MLRERARSVERITEVHQRLVADMIETMRQAPGVGLAGPQVGVMERVFVWEVEEAHGAVFNPEIVEASGRRVTDDEGCLSLPGISYPVERSARVVVTGMDERGRALRIEADDLLARVFQHEIDHLDGVLFVDRLPDELRREAMHQLTQQALGLEPPPGRAQRRQVPAEETF